MSADDDSENSLTHVGAVPAEPSEEASAGTSSHGRGAPERRGSAGADEATFFEHLEELRLTLLWCAAVFVAVGAASLVFSKQIFDFLRWPLEHAAGVPADGVQALVVMRFMDVFSILLYVAFSGAVVFAGPLILYRLGKFVAPAFSPSERSRLIPFCVASSALFLVGAALAFFLLAPVSIGLPYRLAEYFGMKMNWLAEDYYLFVVLLTLCCGLMFELPLFVVFLLAGGFSDKRTLLAKWRWVLCGILVSVLLLSPVGDPASLLAFSGVLFALYLGSIFLGDFISKKMRSREGRNSTF